MLLCISAHRRRLQLQLQLLPQLAAYGVAAGVGAVAASDIGEVFTGHNVIRDDLMGGNRQAYDSIRVGVYVTGNAIVQFGANNSFQANNKSRVSDKLVFGSDVKSYQKLNNQMQKRGWTLQSVKNTVDHPYTLRTSINKATGNSATVYYNKSGSYIIVDDITCAIVQVSDNIAPKTWVPDSSIVNPYQPQK